ncbi:MAG: glycosyltransferase family 9 protein [Desulfobacterales bacterium]|nr:MAG: glycosyltransferase family 9 protein [Desulfobacterales bacterium]
MMKPNLLIVHQGAFGDVVAIFPAIIRLHTYFARIDGLCQSQLGKLSAELGLVTKWYPLETASFASLYTHRADQKIEDLLRSYSQIILFSLSSQLEHSVNRITRNRCLRLPPKPPADERIHITEYVFNNLVNYGLLKQADSDIDHYYLLKNPEGKDNPSKDVAKILIHAGSGSARKRWAISHFFVLEKMLRSEGLKPEFLLGPAEEDLMDTVREHGRKIYRLSDLVELVTLLRTAGGYIGNDSGASHLAAFLGLPSVIIFGPADPERWKPNGPFVEMVRPELECLPCFETDQTNCCEPKCLDDTTPQTVIEAFYRVY